MADPHKIDVVYGYAVTRPEMIVKIVEEEPSIWDDVRAFLSTISTIGLIILFVAISSYQAVKHPNEFATGLMIGTIISAGSR
jgi:hypothetical protein